MKKIFLTLLFISSLLFCNETYHDQEYSLPEDSKEEYFVEITTTTATTNSQQKSQEAVCSIYDQDVNLIDQQIFVCYEEDTPGAITSWNKVKTWLKETACSLQKVRNQISYTEHMQEEWDHLSQNTFSKGYLHLLGYYRDIPESGRTSYGEEINDKVRVTLINGILNLKHDLNSSLKLLSDTHGNTVIHYVFRPTEGWSKDICSSILSKFGIISPYARLLAVKWKEIIEELGGTDGGGMIIHYAHSIGTTDTYMARSLLTKEEQRMIHVISLGSPSMIPKEAGFGSSVNYVSKRDGVCLLDPIGYIKGWMDEDSNVEFLGSFLGIPFVDHMLSNENYECAIRELGLEFSEKFSNKNQ